MYKYLACLLLLAVAAFGQGTGTGGGTGQTAHNQSVPANCVAASASGTAYTCSTSPAFTPASGDHIQFKADVANTGTATLAVNGAAAAIIKKWGGSGALIANDLLAAHWISATFDGTYWQLEGQLGNTPAAPTDPTVAFLKDDFTVKSITTETIGELGWRYTASVSCTPLGIASVLPNVGIFQMTTGAAAGDGCAIDLSGLGPYGVLGAVGGGLGAAEQNFVFKMPQTTNSSMRIGYVIGTAAGVVEPTAGAWLRYEKNPGSSGTTQAAGTVAGNGVTAVYTTPTAHGYHVGDSVTTTLCTTGGFNATGNITAATATTFSVLNATNGSATTCTSKVADTTWKFETRKASASDSFDTGLAPNTSNFYRLRIRNLASGNVGMTLYDNTGAQLASETTFCPSTCTVTSSNVDTVSAMSPAFIMFSATGGGGTAVAVQADFYSFKAAGLVR